MMENRSFDHMLGYLSLQGRADVDGLQAGFANEYQGRSYPVHHLPNTAVAVDPDHSADAVDLQLGGGNMYGFVASYAATLASRGAVEDPGAVMGYYDGVDVPVYDHLADQFVVCDRWFSAVPGATWQNRLYALCGRAAGSRDDLPLHLPPIYNQPSFVRHLNAHGVSWHWYSFDPGTLRLADATFKLGHHDRYAHFTKTGLNWKTKHEVRIGLKAASFLEDAAQGTLPSGVLDRSGFHQRQHAGLSAERRPRAGGHQGRPGSRARRLPRAGDRAAVAQDALDHLLRRARRLLRSCRTARGTRR